MIRTGFVALFALLALVASPSVSVAAQPLDAQLQIHDAKTRVGLMKVILRVSNLQVLHDRIEGDYFLKIPLAPMMNDRGKIRIPLETTIEDAIAKGVALFGRGDSSEDGRTHQIRCEMKANGKVDIRVDTGDRILDFLTRYELAGPPS